MTVLCVVGPTASGKTKMAVALARRLNGEVVSVDSMQIYRGMTIGTAAPTAEEMEGVPHHMIAVADPAEQWSAARFCQAADACIQDILSRGKLPVLAGGTGLYLDALIRGDDFAPGCQGGQTRLRLQQELRELGPQEMLRRLEAVDPETAARLHLRDEKRILRALEIYEETGEPMSRRDRRGREKPDRYQALYIGLNFRDRADLRERIDRRVDEMVRRGLLQEVQALLDGGLPRDATALQAIGYKQFLAVADGTATADQAVEEVKLRSRQYVKRQLTWLRRNPAIHWIYWDKEPDFPAALQNATDFLTAHGLGSGQADSRPHKAQRSIRYAEKQPSGHLFDQSPQAEPARDRVSDERFPDAGQRHRLRQLHRGAGHRRQAAGDL